MVVEGGVLFFFFTFKCPNSMIVYAAANISSLIRTRPGRAGRILGEEATDAAAQVTGQTIRVTHCLLQV